MSAFPGLQSLDHLHALLLLLSILGPILIAVARPNHPQIAKLLEAVIEGVDDADDKSTKRFIRLRAEDAGLQNVLHPLVKQITEPPA